MVTVDVEYITEVIYNLTERAKVVSAMIKDLESVDVNGKLDMPGALPNVRSGDGTTVDHNQFKVGLYKELKDINDTVLMWTRLLAALDITANDAFEFHGTLNAV